MYIVTHYSLQAFGVGVKNNVIISDLNNVCNDNIHTVEFIVELLNISV